MDDRSDLSQLYPTAKSYQQRQADRARINRQKAERASKMRRQALAAVILTSIIIGGSAFVMSYLANSTTIVATTFLAFPVGLINVVALIWSIRSLAKAYRGPSNT